jgi:adenine deaminase
MLNRFSVASLDKITRTLAAVAMGREAPDLVITGARLLSTYSERIREGQEIWIKGGRIAAVKPAGSYPCLPGDRTLRYDAQDGIIAPGLIDPHVHIESSMMSACAYAEGALLNGTTTIFCDCHEIANVCDHRGVDWFLTDARRAPLSIFATVPSTVPATHAGLETSGGDLTAEKISRIFDDWPEAVGLGEKMDFVQVAAGDVRSHAILAESLRRGKPISGHIYGRDFVAANAASGITDTHEAIDRDIADDCLEAGLWIFLRAGPPGSAWHSLPEAIKVLTELGANPKRICLCTDDRDAQDLFLYGMDWVVRQAVVAGVHPATAWSMGSLHAATRFGMDGEIGGLGHSRRADLVLIDDNLEVQNTWYGGELVVEKKKITAVLDKALSKRYKYPRSTYQTIRVRRGVELMPTLPERAARANIMRLSPQGVIVEHHQVALRRS